MVAKVNKYTANIRLKGSILQSRLHLERITCQGQIERKKAKNDATAAILRLEKEKQYLLQKIENINKAISAVKKVLDDQLVDPKDLIDDSVGDYENDFD